MDLDVFLFILRVLSSILLLGILLTLLGLLWRDFRASALEADHQKRIHGQLLVLAHIDDLYAPTGDTYPLRVITSIGRLPTNHIVVEDNYASSEHAVIALRNGQWWLEDRNSRNGTLLNGERITQPVIITEGDIIGIGSFSLRLKLD